MWTREQCSPIRVSRYLEPSANPSPKAATFRRTDCASHKVPSSGELASAVLGSRISSPFWCTPLPSKSKMDEPPCIVLILRRGPPPGHGPRHVPSVILKPTPYSH